MALLQPAPRNEDEVRAGGPLPTPPDQLVGISEEEWYERVYRGDALPQLTLRAVLTGSLLGFVLALTNVYIGLKVGLHLGVSITAGIFSYAAWNTAVRMGVARTGMTLLETNCAQSTASAAGYSTRNIVITSIPALLMLSATSGHPTGQHLPVWVTIPFVFLLAVLGTVLAIPLKRTLINRERLRFPTGVAAAVTLHGLYGRGSDAARKVRTLLVAGGFGAALALLRDLEWVRSIDAAGKHVREALIPASSKALDFLPSVSMAGKTYALSDFNIRLDHSAALLAAGAIVGLRTTVWMMLSASTLAFVLTPWAMGMPSHHLAGELVFAVSKPQSAWKELGLWLGAPMLVASSLVALALNYPALVRAFSSLSAGGGTLSAALAERVRRTEVPTSWFVVGTLAASVPLVWLSAHAFDIPVSYGVLAVLMTFVLCVVACRTTGESDITPVGALGKIMQLTYGTLIPQSASTNLMTAGITAGAASASADLLTDLRAGYLLGANPRRQFVAQALGSITGAVSAVLCFRLLVPDARTLTGGDGADPLFPAPAAQQWKAVAMLFRAGIDSFHPVLRECIVLGLALGVLLALLERFAPERMRTLLPSATGIGLGLILPFNFPLAMFLGALLAYLAQRVSRSWAELHVIAIASGLVTGESTMGVLVAALNTFVLS
jgi:putative OPT family oligopeptide transporter